MMSERVVTILKTTGTGPYTLDFEAGKWSQEREPIWFSPRIKCNTPVAISEDESRQPGLRPFATANDGADYILITHRDVGWDVDVNGDPWSI